VRVKVPRYELNQAMLLQVKKDFPESAVVFHVDNVTAGIRKEFFSAIKGSHFIRDPRDLVISAAHYHKICREKWCSKEVSRVLSQPEIDTLVRAYSMRQPEEIREPRTWAPFPVRNGGLPPVPVSSTLV